MFILSRSHSRLPARGLRGALSAVRAAAIGVLAAGSSLAASAAVFTPTSNNVLMEVDSVRVNLRGPYGVRLAEEAGTPVFRPYGAGEEQIWRMIRRGSGFEFRNWSSGNSLRAHPGSDGAWTEFDGLFLQPWRNWNSFKYNLVWRGNGSVRLDLPNTGLSVGASNTNGTGRALMRSRAGWVGRDARIQRVATLDSPSICRDHLGNLYAYFTRGRHPDDSRTTGFLYKKGPNDTKFKLVNDALPGHYGATLFNYRYKTRPLATSYSRRLCLIYIRGRKVYLKGSDDGGKTWKDYLIHDGGEGPDYQASAGSPVLFGNGHVYWAMQDKGGVVRSFPADRRLMVISAKTGLGIFSASRWTLTNPVDFDTVTGGDASLRGTRKGWLEANMVKGPAGSIWVIARVDKLDRGDAAAALKLSADRKTLSFENQIVDASQPDEAGFLRAPWAGCSKFHIRYDAPSKMYWVLSNPYAGQTPPPSNAKHRYIRNKLALYKSADLRSFTFVTYLAEDRTSRPAEESVYYTGFQTPSFTIKGRYIHAVARTAFDGWENYHQANMITYHSYKFR